MNKHEYQTILRQNDFRHTLAENGLELNIS